MFILNVDLTNSNKNALKLVNFGNHYAKNKSFILTVSDPVS